MVCAMGSWVQGHWRRAIAVALLWFLPLWQFARSIIMLGGDADFVISRSEDPGWVGAMLNFILNPPAWINLPLILAGLAVIYWGTRRNNSKPRDPQRYSKEIPILELQVLREGLANADPWLGFMGHGFNGADHPVSITSASGKVRAGGEHLREQLELVTLRDPQGAKLRQIEPHSFFTFVLSLHLSNEAATVMSPRLSEAISMMFVDAKLHGFAPRGRKEQPFELPLPYSLAFGPDGNPQPKFLNQVHTSS